ncbi:NAD/NADP-dependent octopine/nopaline dehydrogenase family protein [Bacteroides pyogenes]|uniref:NAD/NADP-dependent octopine/nopaline dehydrogenase family protein n=1 Tax=Bacteroides pyogenes TaxID=310300 RepID=UPI0003DD5D3D|nr:NAD/NADP-dependent octopine/nopaline dehydrogenase family protein [Bacteroides pyogenes]MBB3894802.1 opine dehydrogenase [Bacteroides pyogenes]GAE21172.1 NAD/NADP octopine/nopaline dehydrogenase [Bacteroides pyogenes JCM 10003]SUV35252.1 octopine dehydrogenase [Bacteroides pyogenes]
MRFAVIGAGNGGQAIAGYLGLKGYHVNLYDRNVEKVEKIKNKGGIKLEGKINGFGNVNCITNDLSVAVTGTDIIMITTIANAHRELAIQLSPFLQNDQIIILNPGRTCGALEFKWALNRAHCNKRLYIAEAQTLIYACRAKEVGIVNIIGIKDDVLISALPSIDTDFIISRIGKVFTCFTPTSNVLRTSLENIGAIFHPCVILFNAATIERGEEFYFYRDITPNIVSFIEKFDAERIEVGKAYGIDLLSVNEWISFAYKGIQGNTLCEKMRNNPAYHDILAPSSIYTRQLMEDIPTGVLPIMELGKAAGLKMTLFESVINICCELLNINFRKEGRTLKHLGLENLSIDQILNHIQ